jgi:hypothetical protein
MHPGDLDDELAEGGPTGVRLFRMPYVDSILSN